jgi:hypothetical protein
MSKLELHPVLTQNIPRENVSDKYKLVNTSDIIAKLKDRGFVFDNLQAAGVRVADNVDKQKHLVTMRYEEMRTEQEVPTIIIQNSHNRTSGLKFHVGTIRFACLNGIISGSDIEEKSIRHSIGWEEKTNIFLDSYLAKVEKMNRQHNRMRNQYMSDHMIREFAYLAGKIRYDSKDILDSNELALVTRSEDIGNDLYTVFNRIQESLLKGSFKRRIPTLDDDGLLTYSPWQKASKITSTDETLRINKAIRALALKYS